MWSTCRRDGKGLKQSKDIGDRLILIRKEKAVEQRSVY